MPRTSWPIQRRDTDGLMIDQRRVLARLPETLDWREACEHVGVQPERFRTWLKRDEHFQRAYDSLLAPALDVARRMLEVQALEAVRVYREALEAVKDVKQKACCPDCGDGFAVQGDIPDWQARLRASETIFKVCGLLNNRKAVEATAPQPSLEESLALAVARAGRPVPANMLDKLHRMGRLPAESQRQLEPPKRS